MARPHDRPAAVEAARHRKSLASTCPRCRRAHRKAPVYRAPIKYPKPGLVPNSAPAICPSGRWQLIDPQALRGAVDWPRANTKRVDRVEEAFVAEALHVGRSGRSWTSYSRRRDWYASAARYYLPRVFGYRLIIDAIGRLEELGLVDHDRRKPSATRQRNRPTATSHGYQSRFMASERLMALATLQPPLRWEERALVR